MRRVSYLVQLTDPQTGREGYYASRYPWQAVPMDNADRFTLKEARAIRRHMKQLAFRMEPSRWFNPKIVKNPMCT